MTSETETLALHLVRALYEATGGRPQVWRSLEELDVATTDAIEFAVARGWVVFKPVIHLPDRCGPTSGRIALA